ncbi:MAG: tRNA (adenosine(37)-N6)-threonylcarbamoyltransferase complex dimerization subunit type 1 TsaB [Candidatus Pelagibacterales bacterium]|nr:MAG: tRNA (adenosine(37)-N6)-threonylcarbamoyltransferase complex dimerization subunit type 1 TsaB [Pelagibacterales bacterium]
MNFLSIDFSTDIGSLFVKSKNKTFNKNLQSYKSSNDLLMIQILEFFKENNLKLDDISYIFVNQGPGNFSGLRGSLAIAKGVSLAKNLHLFGFNTFIWSCSKFFNKKDYIFSFVKFREKYFVKKFDKDLRSASNAKEITADEIIKEYDNEFKVIPSSVVKYFDKRILKLNNLNIVDLDHNELQFLKLKGLLDDKLIKPLYLS